MEEGEEGFGSMDPKGHGNIKDDSSLYEDEDMDLEELLKELDEDIEDVEGYEDTDADGIEDDSDADSGEEEISLDLEDMTDEDLKKFIEDVISDMFESGELEANIESEEEEEEAEEEGKEEEEEEINLDELLAEIEGMDEEMEEEDMYEEEDMNENTNISELEAELAEAYLTIETLRGDLNEVNLLNAKLLYTNKIFKSKNLTESQKLNVLSSFDKATTVKETKLVYETLSEGLKSKTNRISENLGSASKGIGTTKTKQPIVESNEMVARFQKLAGII
jgi:predicted RNase H-like nuclease (RuvC/YqgF family)